MWLVNMFTTRNVAPIDRLIRATPAVAVGWLWWSGSIGGLLAVGLAALAAMLLATSLTGSCSIYYLLGFSTCPVGPSETRRDRSVAAR